MSRSLLSGLISLAFCATAHAAWRIDVRPLEAAPYTRGYKPLVSISAAAGLGRIEGAGLKLAAGEQVLAFRAPLSGPGHRRLELQLGYLSTAEKADHSARCVVHLVLNGAPRDVETTLRTVHPAGETYADVSSRYDYFMPALVVDLPDDAREVALQVAVPSSCQAGRVVVYDPKVWIERPGPAKRLLIIVADELAGTWFTEGRQIAPAIQRFFSQKGSVLAPAWSNAKDTFNAIRILTRMHFVLYQSKTLHFPDEPPNGLVPAFLNAGYDAISISSNIVLTSAYDGGIGFRSYFDVDYRAPYESSRRHPELLATLMRDWIARHPDHDALLMMWTAATHEPWIAPRARDGVEKQPLIYPQYPKGKVALEQQRRALSYIDLAFEPLLADPLVAASDVLFLADHARNWEHYADKAPDWTSCDRTGTDHAHNLGHPLVIDIPVGLRLHDRPLEQAPPVRVSMLDWVSTAVRRHNPAIDTRGWEGRDVASITTEEPLLFAIWKNFAAAGMHVGGRTIMFAESQCRPFGPGLFRVWDQAAGFPSAGVDDVRLFVRELAKHAELTYRALDLDIQHGQAPCSVTLDGPLLANADGQVSGTLRLDGDGWYGSHRVYVDEVSLGAAEDLVLRAEPAGCLRLQEGLYKRTTEASTPLVANGWFALLGDPPEPLVPDAAGRSVLRLSSPGRHYFEGGAWKPLDPAAARSRDGDAMSTQLKEAMKRWGYIQDDAKK